MGGNLHGADIEALRLLADRIDHGSWSLDTTARTVDAALPDPGAWSGPDAEGFRTEWEHEHSVFLRDTSIVLAEVAARARQNADAQEAVSNGGAHAGSPAGIHPGTQADTPGTPGAAAPEATFRPVAFAVGPDSAVADTDAAANADPAAASASASEEYPPPDVEATEGAQPPSARTPFAELDDLAPNTAYEVDGRGTFYTDDTGRVTHVEAEYGHTGDLNWDLMEPQPNVTYVVGDDHIFVTDDQGRTVEAHATDLEFGEADRSESVQQRIGDQGGDGYDGGHLIGNQFGGGPEDLNLVPMLEEVNRGSGDNFYALEMRLNEALSTDPPSDVEFHVLPEYTGESLVPSTIVVEYSIDGEAERKEFDND